jgi:RNA polymerase primary sigma factor
LSPADSQPQMPAPSLRRAGVEERLLAEDATRAYLRQIGNIPLLTNDEEVFYTRRYRACRDELRELLACLPKLLLGSLAKVEQSTQNELAEMVEYAAMEDQDGLRKQFRAVLVAGEEFSERLDDQSEPSAAVEDELQPLLSASLVNMFGKLALRDCFYDSCLTEALGATPAQSPDDILRERMVSVQQEQEATRQAIVEGNLRLVISVAKRYAHCGMPLIDLIQEGNIGLMRAVERFDPDRGHRFSTYATYWIRQAITRALAKSGRTIRIPSNMIREISQINAAEERLVQEGGNQPEAEAVAQAVGLSVARVRALKKMARQTISLQSTVNSEDQTELADFISDHVTDSPAEAMAGAVLREAIDLAMGTLDQRERRILNLHFGLDGGEPKTLREVSLEFGLTSERIRQIEFGALRKLRHPTRRQFFDGYY